MLYRAHRALKLYRFGGAPQVCTVTFRARQAHEGFWALQALKKTPKKSNRTSGGNGAAKKLQGWKGLNRTVGGGRRA